MSDQWSGVGCYFKLRLQEKPVQRKSNLNEKRSRQRGGRRTFLTKRTTHEKGISLVYLRNVRKAKYPYHVGPCKLSLGFGFYSSLESERRSLQFYEKARREWHPQGQVKKVVQRGRNNQRGQMAELSSKPVGLARWQLLVILKGERSLEQWD